MDNKAFQALYPWEKGSAADSRYAEMYYVIPTSLTPEQLWPVIIDTSRFNRALGFGNRTQEERDGLLHVSIPVFRWRLRWIEHTWSWTFGQHATMEREFLNGPFHWSRAVFHLEKTSTGTNFHVQFSFFAKWPLVNLLLRLTQKGFGRSLTKLVQQLEARVQTSRNLYPPLAPVLPPEAERELTSIAAKLREKGITPPTVDALVQHVATGDEMDLAKIRPLALARATKVDSRELLRACFYGTQVGLLTLSWEINCPHCRGVREKSVSLLGIPKFSECEVCEIEFSTNVENAVEVVFHVHEGIRKIGEQAYCSAEPSKKAHIKWQATLPGKKSSAASFVLSPGKYRLRDLQQKGVCLLTVKAGEEGNATFFWKTGEPAEREVSLPGDVTLQVVNPASSPTTLVLEELWWEHDRLSPGEVFCLPEFQEFAATDYLSAGVQLDLGHQTILFTDVVESTRLYEQSGDAKAFVQVLEHFEELVAVIKKHDGALVKTIGDATMAAFHSPHDSFEAALEIQSIFSQPGKKVSVRMSMHAGPVIAVNWNTGKDYFGSVVNVAAKMQGCVGAQEIVISAEAAAQIEHPILAQALTQELKISGREEKVKVLVLKPGVFGHLRLAG